MPPQISTDGGATWSEIVTRPFPGQPEAFQSLIQDSHAYFIFHATDPNRVFAARFQHFGRSTDGGRTFVWASNNFDYNYVHDIAVDPGDWTQMALAMQDRLLVFTENGGDWVWDDAVDDEVKAEVAGPGRLYRPYRRRPRRADPAQRHAAADHLRRGQRRQGDHPRPRPERRQPDRQRARCPDHGGKVSWCLLGVNDAEDASRGYIGRWRYDLGAGGALTGPVDVSYEVIGVGSGAGVVFGVEKSSGEGIWRSTDYGATWSPWATAPGAVPPDRQQAGAGDRPLPGGAGLMVTASGNAYLIEGVPPRRSGRSST